MELCTWNILHANLSSWKLEYSNIQMIRNSRLTLYYPLTIGVPILGFLFFFFHWKSFLALPQGKNEGNRETDLKYATFRQLSVFKLKKHFCTQAVESLMDSQMYALTSFFTGDNFYILLWCCSGQHFTSYLKKDKQINKPYNGTRYWAVSF